eukprot:SAG31_NODE_66_length_28567_cov_30.222698_19_plen_84_part_00
MDCLEPTKIGSYVWKISSKILQLDIIRNLREYYLQFGYKFRIVCMVQLGLSLLNLVAPERFSLGTTAVVLRIPIVAGAVLLSY